MQTLSIENSRMNRQQNVASRQERTVNSALWAAYGDALGFITELADEERVKHRAKTLHVERTLAWRRLIGGRFGVHVELPAGSISDDTQLRLSTSRAIRGDGVFDVEVFAKVELPVWLSYALGAGRGSKAGAASLSKSGVNWFSNFFSDPGAKYVNGGGNGAAMRVQPHIWAKPVNKSFESCLLDVFRNTICTHGHPRAFVGAAMHAMLLSIALDDCSLPEPNQWAHLVDNLRGFSKEIAQDSDIRLFWLPTWESQSNQKWHDAFEIALDEWREAVGVVVRVLDQSHPDHYVAVLTALGGLTEAERGSGLKTALFALALAWLHKGAPAIALTHGANVLGSDTDTINTMAGALLGAMSETRPPSAVQDIEYLNTESSRLADISTGLPATSFDYPDLLSWRPPRSNGDSLGTVGDKIALSGLGYAKLMGDEQRGDKSPSAIWQWVRLEFGQTILCKRRAVLPELSIRMIPQKPSIKKDISRPKSHTLDSNMAILNANAWSRQRNLLPSEDEIDSKKRGLSEREPSPTIDELVDHAIQNAFDPSMIGRHMLLLCERENGLELVVAYSAVVAKARIARRKRSGA